MSARILVVDDDPNIQRLLTYTLKQEGYEVIVAVGRRRGAEEVGRREPRPDAPRRDAAEDRRLPGRGARSARTRVRRAHVPIIMLTAEADVEQKVRGLRAGADDYQIKPFHPAELLARIKSLLARFAPRDLVIGQAAAWAGSIAFYGAKGGVGTTTIAINTAIALHRELGRKVVLVDGNLQFGDHRVFLDLGLDRKSIVDVVTATTDRPGPAALGPRQARLRHRPPARAALARDGRAGQRRPAPHVPHPGAAARPVRLRPGRHRQAPRRDEPRRHRPPPTRSSWS